MRGTHLFVLMALATLVPAKRPSEKPDWAKKDPIHYTDADMERLLEQWDESEEVDEDDLPEHKRPPPKLDMSSLDPSKPEDFLKMSKKGQTLMTFCTVTEPTTRERTERLSSLWQTALHNNHIQVERYMIADERFIFMFKDGAQAWEAKDFLVQQEELEQILIENKPYYGKRAKNANKDEL
ncbi:LDLR chaperone boca-like [Tropilaelaps mercedesae]|uniref:LDLR chaperone boca-like n=1 Tax=Tropilaelaps mercedesae TaxID=418985 RepID=A0A1V9XEY5_9ACAR|nr:LDLR chaperone boca-like [Tropilaelaps mercedesae]